MNPLLTCSLCMVAKPRETAHDMLVSRCGSSNDHGRETKVALLRGSLAMEKEYNNGRMTVAARCGCATLTAKQLLCKGSRRSGKELGDGNWHDNGTYDYELPWQYEEHEGQAARRWRKTASMEDHGGPFQNIENVNMFCMFACLNLTVCI